MLSCYTYCVICHSIQSCDMLPLVAVSLGRIPTCSVSLGSTSRSAGLRDPSWRQVSLLIPHSSMTTPGRGSGTTQSDCVALSRYHYFTCVALSKVPLFHSCCFVKSTTISLVLLCQSTTISLVSLCQGTTISLVSLCQSTTISLVSLCQGTTISLVSLCQGTTISLVSLCQCTTISLVSLCQGTTISLVSLCQSTTISVVSLRQDITISFVSLHKGIFSIMLSRYCNTISVMSLCQVSVFMLCHFVIIINMAVYFMMSVINGYKWTVQLYMDPVCCCSELFSCAWTWSVVVVNCSVVHGPGLLL